MEGQQMQDEILEGRRNKAIHPTETGRAAMKGR